MPRLLAAAGPIVAAVTIVVLAAATAAVASAEEGRFTPHLPEKVEPEPIMPELPEEAKPPQQAPELHTMGERLATFGEVLNTVGLPEAGWPIRLAGEGIKGWQDHVDYEAAHRSVIPAMASTKPVTTANADGLGSNTPHGAGGHLAAQQAEQFDLSDPANQPHYDEHGKGDDPLVANSAANTAFNAPHGAKKEMTRDAAERAAQTAAGKAALAAGKQKPDTAKAAAHKEDALTEDKSHIVDRVNKALASEPKKAEDNKSPKKQTNKQANKKSAKTQANKQRKAKKAKAKEQAKRAGKRAAKQRSAKRSTKRSAKRTRGPRARGARRGGR